MRYKLEYIPLNDYRTPTFKRVYTIYDAKKNVIYRKVKLMK